MAKLNQILALEDDARQHAAAALKTANATIQKIEGLNGMQRTYQPDDELGERLPPEETRVQASVPDAVGALQTDLARLFDLTATKDWANTQARADVVVEGTVLIAQVPPTYLLFLEKQLAELEGFISRLPTLTATDPWESAPDPVTGLWRTRSVETVKTKKVPRAFVAYEATKEHPAQVAQYSEDVRVGAYTLIKYSGAVTAPRKRILLERVRTLIGAVKTARQEANTHVVTDQEPGGKLLGFLFA